MDTHGNIGSASFTVTAYRQVLRRTTATSPVRDRRTRRPVVDKRHRASDGAPEPPSSGISDARIPAPARSRHHPRSNDGADKR
jgi:hypothetical protein